MIAIVVSSIEGDYFVTVVVTGLCLVTFCVTIWRVRVLGVAMHVMKSMARLKLANAQLETEVDELKGSNITLSASVESLRKENKEFRELLGLLDGQVENLDEIEEKLKKYLQEIRLKNDRYEANNLMNLYFLLDLNRDSTLPVEKA